MTYEFISDPGHGWLKVPMDEVIEADFQPSEFSYHYNGYAYLEEDCDASLFLYKIGVRKPDLTYREIKRFDRTLPRFASRPEGETMRLMDEMYAAYKGE